MFTYPLVTHPVFMTACFCQVLEINSRMASQYQQLVQMMYNQDKMGAFIDLQLGKHVPTPQFSFLVSFC